MGYLRYDSQQELELINQLYRYLRLYSNYFQPSMKLIEKQRLGSQVKKSYDKPLTPYQRVLQSPYVEDKVKNRLRREYSKLNPAELKRQITRLQNELIDLATEKEPVRTKGPGCWSTKGHKKSEDKVARLSDHFDDEK